VDAVRHFLGFAEDSDARVLFVGAVIGLAYDETSLCEWEKDEREQAGRRHSPAYLLATMAHQRC
jgi:hypothetical protein